MGFPGINMLSSDSLFACLTQAHVNGELTIYQGAEEDDPAFPKSYRALEAMLPMNYPEMRVDKEEKEIRTADSLSPFRKNAAYAFDMDWLLVERWTKGKKGPICSFNHFLLRWRDPGRGLPSKIFRIDVELDKLPLGLYDLLPLLHNYEEELNLSEAYLHRRPGVTPPGLRPLGAPWAYAPDGVNDADNPGTGLDPVLGRGHYDAVILRRKQRGNWHSVTTTPPSHHI